MLKKIISSPHFSKLIDESYIYLNYRWIPTITEKINNNSYLYTVNVSFIWKDLGCTNLEVNYKRNLDGGSKLLEYRLYYMI